MRPHSCFPASYDLAVHISGLKRIEISKCENFWKPELSFIVIFDLCLHSDDLVVWKTISGIYQIPHVYTNFWLSVRQWLKNLFFPTMYFAVWKNFLFSRPLISCVKFAFWNISCFRLDHRDQRRLPPENFQILNLTLARHFNEILTHLFRFLSNLKSASGSN